MIMSVVVENRKDSCSCMDASNDLKPSIRHSRNTRGSIVTEDQHVDQCDTTYQYTRHFTHDMYSYPQGLTLNESVQSNFVSPIYNDAESYVVDQHISLTRNKHINHAHIPYVARGTQNELIQNMHGNNSTRDNLNVMSGKMPDDKENHEQYKRLSCDLKPSYRRSGEMSTRPESLPIEVNHEVATTELSSTDGSQLSTTDHRNTCISISKLQCEDEVNMHVQCRNRTSLPLEEPGFVNRHSVLSPPLYGEQMTIETIYRQLDRLSPNGCVEQIMFPVNSQLITVQSVFPPVCAPHAANENIFRKYGMSPLPTSVEEVTKEHSYRKLNTSPTSVCEVQTINDQNYRKMKVPIANDLQVSERKPHKISENNVVSNCSDSNICGTKVAACSKTSILDLDNTNSSSSLCKVRPNSDEIESKKKQPKCSSKKNFSDKYKKLKGKRSFSMKQDCIDERSKKFPLLELNTPNKKLHRIQNIHKRLAKSGELNTSKEELNKSNNELLSKLDDIFPLVSVNQESNRPVRSRCTKTNHILDRKIQSSGIWNSVNSTY